MYQTTASPKELARRTAVYALMTLTVIALLLVLLSQMFGYKLNPQTLTIEQQSLVQYDSFPRGALVAIDGDDFYTTQTKGIIEPGQHQFSMKLEGYEPWQKTLDVKPGTVTRLVYARLVPQRRVSRALAEWPRLQSVTFSPDGRMALGVGVVDGATRAYWADVRGADPKLQDEPLALVPAEALSSLQLTVQEWDVSSRYALMKYHYQAADGATVLRWLRLDRDNPRQVVDISAIAGVELRQVHFAGSGGDELYVLQSNGSVRQLAVGSASLSRPLVTNVQSFVLHTGTETVAYVAREQDQTTVGVWRKGWERPRVVRRADGDEKLQIQASRYFNKDTIVVVSGDAAMIYRGSLSDTDESLEALLQSGKRLSLGRSITSLAMSPGGRMVVVRDSQHFMSYDIERSTISPLVSVTGALHWLDDFHVWHRDEAGQMVLQEFDGANRHSLMPVADGYDAKLSADEKFLYGVAAHDERLVLMRLAMTTKP